MIWKTQIFIQKMLIFYILEKKRNLKSLKFKKSEIRAKNHEKYEKVWTKHENSLKKPAECWSISSWFIEIYTTISHIHQIFVWMNCSFKRKTGRALSNSNSEFWHFFELFLDASNTYCRGAAINTAGCQERRRRSPSGRLGTRLSSVRGITPISRTVINFYNNQ